MEWEAYIRANSRWFFHFWNREKTLLIVTEIILISNNQRSKVIEMNHLYFSNVSLFQDTADPSNSIYERFHQRL